MTTGNEARERVRSGFRIWFRTPPRPHGEVEYTREVSFLELFYDLVYVVLIGRAAHHLAEHVDWAGVGGFATVFGLIWLAWFNGTFWHELHARGDGRSRNYIFSQMGLLALLAVFAGDATGDDGRPFAFTLAVLFVLYTWQWYQVHRIDEPEYRPTTTRYLIGMVASVGVFVVSGFVTETVRVWLWAGLVALWVVGGVALVARNRTDAVSSVTASMVERIGLFVIIVLGEVVVGVVTGIADTADRSAITIVTGVLGLSIGMGMWWNYFDLLGRRLPVEGGPRLAAWMYPHLPLTMAIASGGAAMVSLVEHAGDARSPANTAWLLTGSVVMVLAGVMVSARALPDAGFPPGVKAHIAPTFGLAMVVILATGAARPSPLVLVVLLSVILSLTWFWLFSVYLARGGTKELVEAESVD